MQPAPPGPFPPAGPARARAALPPPATPVPPSNGAAARAQSELPGPPNSAYPAAGRAQGGPPNGAFSAAGRAQGDAPGQGENYATAPNGAYPAAGRAQSNPPGPWITPPGPAANRPQGAATVPAHHGPPIPLGSPTPPPGLTPPAGPAADEPPPRRRRMRPSMIIALTGICVLVVFAAGLVVVRPGPVAGWFGDDSAARSAAVIDPPDPAPGPVLGPLAATAPTPDEAGLTAAIGKLVTDNDLGGRTSVVVRDVVSGNVIYGNGGDLPTVPASTMKLVTAAAVLATRGAAYKIPTRVVAGPNPGEVILVGGGDPTLAVNGDSFYGGAARLDKLAAATKKALGGTAPTKVYYDSSLYSGPVYGPGWDADIPTGGFGGPATALTINGARISTKKSSNGYAERYAKPDEAAAKAFAKALGVSGTPAVAPAGSVPKDAGTPSPAASASPGAELARVESPPMVRLVEYMLVDSDNVVAEALARQVAIAKGQPASYAGARTAVTAALGDLGLSTTGLVIADGSGLSRSDRLTPESQTELLATAASGKHPELTEMFAGLPVASWSGTLDDRFGAPADKKAAAGVIRAKTGTLTGNHAMAGLVTTADGRLLAFSILTDGVQASSEAAHAVLDRIAATLAGCGCRG
ncbi:D-alanyl-D-alanine carboxypeptidase/D-alanyl-D-alanine-endopeptidase [Asanoa sp. NPDC049573]|uniref:D-alanyl-D-alanine carboxypeptidase/D-alanyl-D-alanine endopeptidase n=1 Tax=Asanoa sp. NPDC049573 TaxID=3155396 RepID=UPI00343991DF